MTKQHTPTELTLLLAAHGHADVRTVRRWLADPSSVKPAIAQRLQRAYEELTEEGGAK